VSKITKAIQKQIFSVAFSELICHERICSAGKFLREWF
jgi:hypothetical protein